ncbi:uncharacterized protein LOC114469388 isoform X2 [Gouania willdenowi]|uniref:uncharacterized protein LOC114469388 isoform X2 n=1 Tax=Gouania willdenowi TaxID=441366 RepID=UPI00105583A5|nr:uncharacterized protein LOC114469388 isoform X2 [Gouania willdenowi]
MTLVSVSNQGFPLVSINDKAFLPGGQLLTHENTLYILLKPINSPIIVISVGEFYFELMKRKRRSLRLLYDSDDADENREEAQCIARRLRNKATNMQKEEEEDNKKEVISGFLHVTCGTKKGFLDVGKLEKREACILCEGGLLTPTAFENFGGKGHSKKWKASIYYNSKPLNFWMEQGHLLPNGCQRFGTAQHAKEPSEDTHSEDLSTESEEYTEEDVINISSESENLKDEDLGEADCNEEEIINGDVSCDEVLTAANSADNKNTQESERTSIISTPVKHMCTNIVKIVLERHSEDLNLHQINGSVSQEEEGEEEPNSSHTPLSEAETGDLSINNNNNNKLPVADVSCVPLKESSQHSEEQKDPLAADEDHSKAAFTDSSFVEEDGQDLIESNDSAQYLEEILPATFPHDSSPAELMEPHTSEKEDTISDVEKNEALGPSTKSFVELENSSPIIIISEVKTLELNTWAEDSLTNVTESFNVDGMDLDKLKKEKIKMQLKVLKLQEEYYKLKIRKLKE